MGNIRDLKSPSDDQSLIALNRILSIIDDIHVVLNDNCTPMEVKLLKTHGLIVGIDQIVTNIVFNSGSECARRTRSKSH